MGGVLGFKVWVFSVCRGLWDWGFLRGGLGVLRFGCLGFGGFGVKVWVFRVLGGFGFKVWVFRVFWGALGLRFGCFLGFRWDYPRLQRPTDMVGCSETQFWS